MKPRFICEFAMFPAIVAFTVTNTNGKACGVGFLEATLCWQRRGRSECLSQGEVPGRTEWSGLRAGTTSFHPEWALPAGKSPTKAGQSCLAPSPAWDSEPGSPPLLKC